MNYVKTKHRVNLRSHFHSSHSTPGYAMLSASVWGLVCKWFITVVPFYLQYSQQGGCKENSTGQHVHERAWLVKQKKRAIPRGCVPFLNITHCIALHVDALSVFVACSLHISQPQSPLFSHLFCSFFVCVCLLPCQSSIVLPICSHFAKPREIIPRSVWLAF